jgi:hypothetical protein
MNLRKAPPVIDMGPSISHLICDHLSGAMERRILGGTPGRGSRFLEMPRRSIPLARAEQQSNKDQTNNKQTTRAVRIDLINWARLTATQ